MVYDELEELTRRLTTLVVIYPDFGVRLDHSTELYNQALVIPNFQLVNLVMADLMELNNYFHDIYENVKEVRGELKPIMSLIQGLLEPV